MKKQLLALAILGSSLANAQVWSENFSSSTVPGLPAGWTQVNGDGLTVSTSLSAYAFGSNAWVTYNSTASYPTYGKCVASTSWYNPTGTSNDWLITPTFTVPANGILEWDAIARDPQYPDGYQVKLSTAGTGTANFTTNLLTVSAENASWTHRVVNLNAYAGQTVNIAFVNNSNDKFILLMDNFNFMVPPSDDGSAVSITSVERYLASASPNIAGQFKSMGYSPANTAVLNYNVNNGAVTTQTFTFGSPLNFGQSTNYSFTTPAALTLGYNKIKVWVSHVNGVAETNLANDTTSYVVYRASKSVTRNVLVEEWSSSTCAPCRVLNVTNGFNALLNGNNPNTGGLVNVIKYQMNWPSPGDDPSYNPDGLARRIHYDVNAVPQAFVNGRTEMQNHSQAEIDAGKLEPAFADITATLSVTGSTAAAANHTVTASATITPWVTISANSPVRVYQVLVQSGYSYSSCSTCTVASNPQTEYFHIMRKMNPNGWGTPTVITDGTPFTVSFNHTPAIRNVDPTPAQNSYSFWTSPSGTVGASVKNDLVYEYVVFIQDTVTNHVLQTASWSDSVHVPTPPQPTVTSVADLTSGQSLAIFPNPAKDYATLSLNVEKSTKVDLAIYDISGRLVYENKGTEVPAGKNEMNINTSELATGTYQVVVHAGKAVLKEKLIVSK
ncbi:MAG: choice-of-anchor J domain-containing protein [Bacteroidia bacterium]|nr:choice-of-anchor J domain-containing protein [Bacteroidia bacterium]